jgi:hypothetical protein
MGTVKHRLATAPKDWEYSGEGSVSEGSVSRLDGLLPKSNFVVFCYYIPS